MSEIQSRKLLSAVSHASALFSSTIVSFLIPLAILIASEDEVVKQNARESINFQFNMFLWGIIGGILSLVLVGFAILAVVIVASLIMPIFATIHAAGNDNQPYRYPGMISIVR